MKELNKKLSAQVHQLKPVVIIGQKGLTESVQAEIDQALEHHELIKIKVAGGDHTSRAQIIADVCSTQQATLIKQVGHVFAIYRKKRQA